MNGVLFQVPESDVELFVVSLALGILEGIKSKSLLHEVGTWSLARPVFLSVLAKEELITPQLKSIIEQFDELNLLHELDEKNCDATICSMISELKSIMLNIDEDACRISCG